jgi:FkbM family methyltransferase
MNDQLSERMISYAQNFEDVILLRALRHVDTGFYVDIGANDPGRDSVTRAFYDRGWRGVNVEPMPDLFALLEAQRPRDVNLACAVGAVDGSVEIWEPETPGWATGRRDIAEALMIEGHVGVYRTVPTTTLAGIFSRWAPENVHFLKIDVEGMEKEVLAGADFSRHRPWIIVIESTYPNSTRQVYEEWEPVLLTNGYSCRYADGLNRFYLAVEHDDLSPSLIYPPNALDHFKSGDQHQAEADASESRTNAAKAAQWGREMEAALILAEARAAAAEQRIQELDQTNRTILTRAEQAEAAVSEALNRAAQAAAARDAADADRRHSEAGRQQADIDRHQADIDRRQSDADRQMAISGLEQSREREVQLLHRLASVAEASQEREARWQERLDSVEKAAGDTETRLQQRLQELEVLGHELRTRVQDADVRAWRAEAEYAAVLRSTSWRLTGPMRLLRRAGTAIRRRIMVSLTGRQEH